MLYNLAVIFVGSGRMRMSAVKSILVFHILFLWGLWRIFKKMGISGWKALIPGYRFYVLGRAVDCEQEGRVLFLLEILSELVRLTDYLPMTYENMLKENVKLALAVFLCYLLFVIMEIIYQLRVYSGLCHVFGRKKWWLFGFALFEGVTVFIWGMKKDIVPVNLISWADGKGAAKSHGDVVSTGSGLNINIKERTVKILGKNRALLEDIHMNIPRGHMVLLLGGSGAGKTTFVNAVTGYEQADARILLDDRDIYTEYEKMKYSVGFVPQQDLMRGHDTVGLTLSDAASVRLPASVGWFKRRKRIKTVLEEFGLASVRDSLVEKLSGGQRKRLSIAMEYISDPSLFILDEPDSGLDGIVARGIFEKLRTIADENKIVIVITHTPDRVADLFDDVIVLAKDDSGTGRLAFFGSVEDARTFFDKNSMEGILRSINRTDEGGEGRANEFVEKYAAVTLNETREIA